MEQGGRAAPALLVVEQHTELGAGADLGLEVGVADGHGLALAADAADAVHQLVQARSAEATAYAALDGDEIGGRPHQIRARAHMAAEAVMVVVAQAERGGQVLGEAPFVLAEHRPHLLLVHRAPDAGVQHQAVGQLGIPVLGAHGQQMVFAQRLDVLGVPDGVGGFELARRADARIARGACIGGDGAALVVGVGARHAGLQLAVGNAGVVAQGDLRLVELDLVGIAVGHACATARGVVHVAQLALAVVVAGAVGFGVQPDLMVLGEGDGQARAQRILVGLDGRGAALADAAARRAGLQVRAVAVIGLSAQRQAHHVFLDRAIQIEAQFFGIPFLRVYRNTCLQLHRATPCLGDLAGDDVDHAAHGVRAVERGHRATDHLDAFDGGDGRNQAGERAAKTVGRDVAAGVLATAVDEQQRVIAGHAADADVQAAGLARGAAHVNAFHVLERFGQVAVLLGLQFFARDDRNGGGRLGKFLLEAGGRDHHFGQSAGDLGMRLQAKRGNGSGYKRGAQNVNDGTACQGHWNSPF
ncbi:hypothetical protein SDC9_78433 [bioreactor metagenome]|uniref:Uncharacterized protein n=1 Tax=bioreactor metagenome TaxID=1076179 RepID=A0A644YTN8_9ZZZZ